MIDLAVQPGLWKYHFGGVGGLATADLLSRLPPNAHRDACLALLPYAEEGLILGLRKPDNQ